MLLANVFGVDPPLPRPTSDGSVQKNRKRREIYGKSCKLSHTKKNRKVSTFRCTIFTRLLKKSPIDTGWGILFFWNSNCYSVCMRERRKRIMVAFRVKNYISPLSTTEKNEREIEWKTFLLLTFWVLFHLHIFTTRKARRSHFEWTMWIVKDWFMCTWELYALTKQEMIECHANIFRFSMIQEVSNFDEKFYLMWVDFVVSEFDEMQTIKLDCDITILSISFESQH